jgi:hypothetical protein
MTMKRPFQLLLVGVAAVVIGMGSAYAAGLFVTTSSISVFSDGVSITPPREASVTFPSDSASYAAASFDAGCQTGSGDICGTAAFAGTGESVTLSIRRGSGNYWDGTSFSSETEMLHQATGTTSWSFSFAASNFPGEGSYMVRVVAADSTGEATTTSTFAIDPTPPIVASITALSPVNSSSIAYTVTFSESVSPVVASDFSLAAAGVTGASISSVSGSGTTRMVIVSSGAGDGTVRLNLNDLDSSIKDAANNPVTPNTFTSGSVVTVDRTVPSAPAITFPVASTAYSLSGWAAGCSTSGHDICGTAADLGGSNLRKVEISIQKGTGNYWNGSGFASATEVFNQAAGTSTWSYDMAGASMSDGQYTVAVKAFDNASNAGAKTTLTYKFDATAPSVSISFPDALYLNLARYTAGCNASTNEICGTASDETSGLASTNGVLISIRNNGPGTNANRYYSGTGTTWCATAGCAEIYFAPSGTATWTQTFATSMLVNGNNYTVHAKATDAAGNVSAVSEWTFTYDTTPPATPSSGAIATTNGGATVGKAEAGDTITYNFTEKMDPASILAGWTGSTPANVTVTLTNGGTGNDSLTITGVNLGSLNLGDPAFVTANVAFDNSSMAMTGNAVTVTLGTASNGSVGTQTANKRIVWTPSSSATDLAGNACPVTTRNSANTAQF